MLSIYEKPHKDKMLLISFLFIILIFALSFINIYSVLSVVVEKEENRYTIVVEYDKISELKNSYLLINGDKYRLKNIIYEDTFFQNDNIYYKVSFEIDSLIKQDIINGKILYNKQRMIFKLFNIVGS